MELQGNVTIPAALAQVWQALNDPHVLRLCIPGCEEVKQIAPDEMHARVMLKLGPVRARFAGKVKMTDIRPQVGYTLNFEGSGGSAGFARGSSVITLSTVEGGTQLQYTATASVAGKLGQIGGRLMDASAGQLAAKFFDSFKAHLSGDVHEALVAVSASEAVPFVAKTANAPLCTPTATSWAERELPRLVWFVAGVAATCIGVWMGAHWLR